MNVDTGNVEYIEPEKKERYVTVGEIIEIKGSRFRVTGMKPHGRLFLKLVKS